MASELVQCELSLFEPVRRTAFELENALNRGHQLPVRVKTHRNQVTMVSIKFHTDHILCRLHEAFLSAPAEVISKLNKYLCHRRNRDWATVADFAQRIETRTRHKPSVKTEGQVYDLAQLLIEVNQQWFNNEIDVLITWGRNPNRKKPGRRHTSIHFGSFAANANLIRIHPRLDSENIPREFIKFVIYHEMLHIVHPPFRRNGRWVFHSDEFKAAERKYPNFNRMQSIADSILANIHKTCIGTDDNF